MSRVAKKLITPFQKFSPDSAILVVNIVDPQVSTMKVFLEAIKENNLDYFLVANKIDLVEKEKVKEIEKALGEKMLPVSMLGGRGIENIKKEINNRFRSGAKIIILGVFNSGKTSLIAKLTGLDLHISNLPGTTLEFTEYKYDNFKLIDTVGQVIDISKPLMISVDLSDCKNLKDKIERILRQDAEGILSTAETAVPQIEKVVPVLKKQITKGGKLVIIGAGASALVAMEMAGQAMETGLVAIPITNNLASAQPVSFSKGTCEDDATLARYINYLVNPGDVVIGISASGGTGFIYFALELAKKKRAITISITENPDTPLGKASNYIIKSNAKPEGPSSSKIQAAHLAIGHALIISLADERGVTADESVSYMLSEKVANKKMGIK